MDSSLAIKTEKLGKQYQLGVESRRYGSFRELLQTGLGNVLRGGKPKTEPFWALRGIDLEIATGERVGLIGRNGAGKSTLLKLLSRITWPTEGAIHLRGRVASLLEVGTGFHPELTGRENIFLNGAILGMTKRDIKQRFDAIVDFAEVEQFLDTPVKRYSSGMYVRLAFAVAAHLEPDILIIDEVLAVGDAQFQQKCVGRLENIGKNGRTIVVVSHNMALVNALCSRAVLLSKGAIVEDGPAATVTLSYYGSSSEHGGYRDFREENVGSQDVRLLDVRIENGDRKTVSVLDIDESLLVTIRFRVIKDLTFKRSGLYPQLNLLSAQGDIVFASIAQSGSRLQWAAGEYTARVEIPNGLLNAGSYALGVGLAACDVGTEVHFYQPSALNLTVSEQVLERLEARSGYAGPIPGHVRPTLNWTVSTAG
jgi:lipopolysaccharide transport system ATP-binding protein